MAESKLRVAVVGGGVCGLTCAIALLRQGVDVNVYEAAPKFGEIGAGIGIGRNAAHILTALGVYEDVQALSLQTEPQEPVDERSTRPVDAHAAEYIDHMRDWFKFVSGMPGHEVVCDFQPTEAAAQGMHRAAFLDALVGYVDPARTHFHKRCTHLSSAPGGATTIHFQDGTTATADVVLGADGIKSGVRRFVADSYGAPVDPNLRFSRTICFRALIPVEKAAAAGVQTDFRERPICFVGKNKHLIIFTVRAGTLINVVAFGADSDSDPAHYPPPVEETVHSATTAEVLAFYEGWGPEVRNLLSCAENPSKWSINVVYPPLGPEKWARGNVAVLGDAAHGMLPHQGAGAGQGIEDAYLLGKLLGHPQTTLSNVEAVLQAYATIRHPRAQRVWEDSRHAGDIYEGRAGYEGIRQEELQAMSDFVWSHPLDADYDRAVEALVAQGIYQPA